MQILEHQTENTIKKISTHFNLTQEAILRESMIALLEKKLREVQTNVLEIHGKYKIQSIYEFENLYKTGKIEESISYQDYQNLDHLEYKKEIIEGLLKELK